MDAVNDYCRFCNHRLRNESGQIHHSKLIFDRKKTEKDKNIFVRLRDLGLSLSDCRDKSSRSCVKCDTLVKRLESALPAFRKWKEDEKVSGSNPAASAAKTSTSSHGLNVAVSSTTSASPTPSTSIHGLNLGVSSTTSASPTPSTSSLGFNLATLATSASPTPSSHGSSSSDKRPRVTPSKTPRTLKKIRPNPPSPARTTPTSARRSITEVITKFPSKTVAKVSQPEEAGIVTNITNQNWKTAAAKILKHKDLAEEVKIKILDVIESECKTLCNRDNGCMLWRSAPGDLKSFTFEHLESDLRRLSPFLLSIVSTITKDSVPATCAAAAIALRGREPRMSAFAYYIDCILQYGGAKKAVFERLSKMAITTTHNNAVGKQKELAHTCGEAVQGLKLENEEYLKQPVAAGVEEKDSETGSVPEMEQELANLNESMEELNILDSNEGGEDTLSMLDRGEAVLPFSDLTNEEMMVTVRPPPPTYSIIFDNLDFFIRTHHQSLQKSNLSMHWIHHIAVRDRIPIYQLSNRRPIQDLLQYDVGNSLPSIKTQEHMRNEFIVIGSRMLTKHLAAFKPLEKVVVHHIPHQYSDEMAQRSTDYPLGLIFKNENITADLTDVLFQLQNKYVPKQPGGLSPVFFGGDRLSEANSRNIQWAFNQGETPEKRLEGMHFKFEDWHAIRNLFEIHHKIFYKEASAKEHGTLIANMNMLKCSNAKQGPHKAYNAYKEFVSKDTTALFLAAAMEHLGLADVTEIPADFIPPAVLAGTREEQRTWLSDMVADVVDRFVKFNDDPRSTPLQRDHKTEHTEARLSFGFFLLNMLDAVKEGDGERLMRLYLLALKLYRAYGHTQYAYSTFLMTVQLKATLAPRLAHSLTWNRFWNGRGGNGKNISLDLHLEHLNNFLKSFLKGLGPNISEQSASRISQSIGVLKEMMDNTDRELKLSRPTGIHHAVRQTEDVLTLVNVFREAELFRPQNGRQFLAFPKFSRDLFSNLHYDNYCQWMRNKLREWRKLQI